MLYETIYNIPELQDSSVFISSLLREAESWLLFVYLNLGDIIVNHKVAAMMYALLEHAHLLDELPEVPLHPVVNKLNILRAHSFPRRELLIARLDHCFVLGQPLKLFLYLMVLIQW